MTIEERREALAWAGALADEAGRLAVERRGRNWGVEWKSDGSVVTDVDRAVEMFLRERIAARYPSHSILGEEYGLDARAESGAPMWAIDPIDGTTNFANGLPMWGVSLGLIADGEPAVGALSFPMLGESFAGAKGLGATHNGRPMPQLSTGGPMHWEDPYAVCSVSVRLIDFDNTPTRVRVLGSAALEICWTSAGLVRGCQSIGVSLHDVAAALCIAREVGADAAWLRSDDTWSALDMLHNGKRTDDALITAPPGTMAYIRENLRFRG